MKFNLINRFKNFLRKEYVYETLEISELSFMEEFNHLLEFINERTQSAFSLEDRTWDFIDEYHSALLLAGNYVSETDSVINGWEEVDYSVFTTLEIYYNPTTEKYKVNHIVPLREYRELYKDCPVTTYNLSFHDLMIYLNEYLEAGSKVAKTV